MYQRAMNGPVRAEVQGMPDLRPRELLAVAPLVVLLIGAGVYPKPVLDIINPAVRVTMAQVHMTDPKPAHPAGSTTAQPTGTANLTSTTKKGIAP
jgi:NADH-quinone oxidoreductase subunit M